MAKKKTGAGSPQATTVELPDGELTVVRANVHRQEAAQENYVSLYANDTQIQVTPWDFRFIFGNIVSMPTPADPSVQVRLIGDVRMSPQHAKRVAMVLLQQVQNYEKTVGPIPQPD